MKKIILICFCLLFFSQHSKSAWMQGKPLPSQKSFWVLETGLKYRIADKNVRYNKGSGLGTFELGYFLNRSPKKSIGISFYGSGDDDGSLFALRYRYRYWLNQKLSVELSPGIIIAGSDNYVKVKKPSFLMSVSMNASDLVAVDLHLQVVRYIDKRDYSYITPINQIDKSGTQTSLYAGARFGSYAAIISTVAFVVVAAISVSSSNFGI